MTEINGEVVDMSTVVLGYTYNENGLLATKSVKTCDGYGNVVEVGLHEYEYTLSQVYPNAIDEMKVAEGTGIVVYGKRIIAQEGMISVYNLGGQKVAEAEREVVVPAEGVYIVNTQGQTVKVVVR